LTVANSLAYHNKAKITAVKLYSTSPRACITNLFTAKINVTMNSQQWLNIPLGDATPCNHNNLASRNVAKASQLVLSRGRGSFKGAAIRGGFMGQL
jgi:hypothetical protein